MPFGTPRNKPTMDTAAETTTLVAADKVQGAKIYSATGDNLGSVDDIMIDQKSGNIAYAIMSVGGFLGIGSRYYPLPWSMLRFDTNLGGYVANVDRAQLQGAPAYGRWH
jgi:sporulation protein YlmC with PRC-barrel domain